MAGHDAVPSVDRRDLRVHNILGLGLGDLYLRLQLRRVGDARQVIAGFDSLPDLHRQLLQDAVHAGFHVKLLNLVQF